MRCSWCGASTRRPAAASSPPRRGIEGEHCGLPPFSAKADAMTEQISFSSLGHRGDGIAETPAGPLYVSYTLPGETVTVEAVAGHPDRRQLQHINHPNAKRKPTPNKHNNTSDDSALQH